MPDRSSGRESPEQAHVERCVEAVVARLYGETTTFAEAGVGLAAEYDALLRAVAQTGPAYAFDRDGRPPAIEAVHQALPAVERDLFDVILDDYACERAAVEEALYRVALAYGRRCRLAP
jgi:hypothetical protein